MNEKKRERKRRGIKIQKRGKKEKEGSELKEKMKC